MSTVLHDVPVPERRTDWLRLPEVWASLAITAIWLAVAVAAAFGPDLHSETPGGTSSTVPSGVIVALFATIATWAIARYGFRRERR